MKFPQKFRAGDFIQWRLNSTTDNFNDPISSPEWTVIYYFRTNTDFIGATATSTSYSDGFQFSLASDVTETFSTGFWYYQAVANKSGTKKQTIASGKFEVLPNLTFSGSNPQALDGRTQAQKDFDAIEAAIRAIYNGGVVQEYKIGNRDVKKYDLPELIILRDKLKAILVREKKAEIIANGLGNPHNLYIRNRG
tara:strand:+ start:910 stop:1491 length:582 start_codon:yes stop_codon:yes gene_type:complete